MQRLNQLISKLTETEKTLLNCAMLSYHVKYDVLIDLARNMVTHDPIRFFGYKE